MPDNCYDASVPHTIAHPLLPYLLSFPLAPRPISCYVLLPVFSCFGVVIRFGAYTAWPTFVTSFYCLGGPFSPFPSWLVGSVIVMYHHIPIYQFVPVQCLHCIHPSSRWSPQRNLPGVARERFTAFAMFHEPSHISSTRHSAAPASAGWPLCRPITFSIIIVWRYSFSNSRVLFKASAEYFTIFHDIGPSFCDDFSWFLLVGPSSAPSLVPWSSPLGNVLSLNPKSG